MPYTSIWIHCVWTTKYNKCIITNKSRPVILTHILENAKKKEILLDCINAYQNHVHALIVLRNNDSLSDIMHLIKGESSHWINKMKLFPYRFAWQDDYYAVSVSPSNINKVRNYIKNQENHHYEQGIGDVAQKFLDEYEKMRKL
jgi:REP element-mobilizing transposase RayT